MSFHLNSYTYVKDTFNGDRGMYQVWDTTIVTRYNFEGPFDFSDTVPIPALQGIVALLGKGHKEEEQKPYVLSIITTNSILDCKETLLTPKTMESFKKINHFMFGYLLASDSPIDIYYAASALRMYYNLEKSRGSFLS